jgi:hypothetical protein
MVLGAAAMSRGGGVPRGDSEGRNPPLSGTGVHYPGNTEDRVPSQHYDSVWLPNAGYRGKALEQDCGGINCSSIRTIRSRGSIRKVNKC